MSITFVKRAFLAVPVLVAILVVTYGYAVTRRERLYRHLIVEGDTLLARNDARSAVTAFTDAIALKPDSMLGYLKRGDAERRTGDLGTAAADLEKARSLNPTEPRVLELLGDVASSRHTYAEAADYYAAYVRLDDRPRGFYKLGLARHLAGQNSEAVEALQQAVGIDNRFAEAHYLLGVCLREMKRLQAAQSAFERAITVSPNLFLAREQLAEIYAMLGRRPERIKQLEDLLVADASAVRHVTLARAYADAGQVQRAVRMLRVAADLYPAYAGTYVALGKVWLDLAVAEDDDEPLSRAVQALERAVSMEASSTALNLLGRARLVASDVLAAERTFAQATETLPVEPSAFLHLADAAELLGRARTARRALLDYEALTGAAEPEFLVRVARAHWRMGDVGAARSALARVFERDPDNQRARDLQRLLR